MKDYLDLILKELEETLHEVSHDELEDLIQILLESRRVIVVGVGRVMISLKAWVKRFRHLGIDINYLGNEVEMPVDERDIVIVASSSGESLICKVMAEKAKEVGSKVFYIGCSPKSTVSSISDYKLIMPGRTKFAHKDEYKSKQPMSTLFEQQLYILGDWIALVIMNKKQLDENTVKMSHANLE